MRTARSLSAVTVLVVGLAGAALAGAASASAHVTVTAPGVSVGATDAAITFRVPTESATADTVGVQLQLPTDTPLVGVLVASQPGWTATVTQTTLAKPITTDDGTVTEVTSEIDWKAADGAGIKPGYYGEFRIIVGQLPKDTPTLTFKAIQNYSDNSQTDWIETPAAGSNQEPEHPAPALDLAASATSDAPTAGASASRSTTTAAAATGASKGVANTGLVLGIIGVALGAAALALTVARGRRRPAGGTDAV